MSRNSKKGTAPCGHPGTYVTPGFVSCDFRCRMVNDAVPEHIDPEKTKQLCPNCLSADVEVFDEFKLDGSDLYFCNRCQRAFEVGGE